ncbi:MAG: DUF1080 domain-containing protein [Planctomycetaceae bacterium]|jgi:hypothetical protein|nr:DUF1080 domain-containing protein [Planctomycetaceae bacterium]
MKKNQTKNNNTIKNYSISEKIKIASIVILFLLLKSSFSFSAEQNEKGLEWLFDKYEVADAVSLIPQNGIEGWTSYYGKEPNKGKWSNKDGKLTCIGSRNDHRTGDIVSKEEYENFILDFEWINSKGGNSGIKYKLKDFGEIGAKINQSDSIGWLGCEYQILDDYNNREGTSNRRKNCAASLYSTIAPSENKKLNPHDQINVGRIVVADERVEHWINGEKVLEYNTDSEDWMNALKRSKYARAEGFAKNKKGFIMLQDHGNKVTFTKLAIRKLKTKK